MAFTNSTDSLLQRLEAVTGDVRGCQVVVGQLALNHCGGDPCHIHTLDLIDSQLERTVDRLNEIVTELMAVPSGVEVKEGGA